MRGSSGNRVVGVLGGMGPYATLAFFKTLLGITPAEKDWDHLHILLDNNPHIPSRSRYLIYGEESPFDAMLDSCRRLELYPVDAIAVPCNSASIFVSDLQAKISVPIFNICEVTAEALARNYHGASNAAVFGGYITYARRIYEQFLTPRNIKLVDHGPETQELIVKLIEELKLGNADSAARTLLQDMIRKVVLTKSVDAVILGCTEMNMLFPIEADIPIVDSSVELAKSVVAFARST